MAKTDSENITPKGADEYSVDYAFRYLTRVVGLQDSLAIYELTEALLRGRLAAECRHSRDGRLLGQGLVKADFWRDHLTLELAKGRARVRTLKALEPGEYEYLLPSQTVRMLWGPPGSVPNKEQSERNKAGRKPEFDWDAIHAEALRRIDDKGHPSNISKFTNDLIGWCQKQFGEDQTPDKRTAVRYVTKWIAGWSRSLPVK
jgi:hypothetical protein